MDEIKLNELKEIVNDERGDTGFVEWILLVGLVALFCIAAFSMVGESISFGAENAAMEIEAAG